MINPTNNQVINIKNNQTHKDKIECKSKLSVLNKLISTSGLDEKLLSYLSRDDKTNLTLVSKDITNISSEK